MWDEIFQSILFVDPQTIYLCLSLYAGVNLISILIACGFMVIGTAKVNGIMAFKIMIKDTSDTCVWKNITIPHLKAE